MTPRKISTLAEDFKALGMGHLFEDLARPTDQPDAPLGLAGGEPMSPSYVEPPLPDHEDSNAEGMEDEASADALSGEGVSAEGYANFKGTGRPGSDRGASVAGSDRGVTEGKWARKARKALSNSGVRRDESLSGLGRAHALMRESARIMEEIEAEKTRHAVLSFAEAAEVMSLLADNFGELGDSMDSQNFYDAAVAFESEARNARGYAHSLKEGTADKIALEAVLEGYLRDICEGLELYADITEGEGSDSEDDEDEDEEGEDDEDEDEDEKDGTTSEDDEEDGDEEDVNEALIPLAAAALGGAAGAYGAKKLMGGSDKKKPAAGTTQSESRRPFPTRR